MLVTLVLTTKGMAGGQAKQQLLSSNGSLKGTCLKNLYFATQSLIQTSSRQVGG